MSPKDDLNIIRTYVAKLEARVAELEAALAFREAAITEEADNFSVSGVYFNEPCMGHKGLAMACAALAEKPDAKAG